MTEIESFTSEEKSNYIESINIPTFSFTTIKYKKKKIRHNKKSDNGYEDLSVLKINNNNENENQIRDNEDYSDIESFNKIMIFNKSCVLDENKKLGIKCGRKKKNSSEVGNHNKYSGDNLIRKCKGIILHHIYLLINHLIDELYKDDKNYDKKQKRLLKINQCQIQNSNVKFNKEFLYKKLKDIFSEKVTSRCSTFNSDHNKILIEKLLNEENQEK